MSERTAERFSRALFWTTVVLGVGSSSLSRSALRSRSAAGIAATRAGDQLPATLLEAAG